MRKLQEILLRNHKIHDVAYDSQCKRTKEHNAQPIPYTRVWIMRCFFCGWGDKAWARNAHLTVHSEGVVVYTGQY